VRPARFLGASHVVQADAADTHSPCADANRGARTGHAALDETKVVLLHAPAGYGKTTTLIQLHRRFVADGVACAWLQLDDADNDLSRFMRSLQQLLPPLEPGRGGAELVERRLAAGDSGAVVEVLLDARWRGCRPRLPFSSMTWRP
jgi:LuxR family maltose regulon positive regulatory protein